MRDIAFAGTIKLPTLWIRARESGIRILHWRRLCHRGPPMVRNGPKDTEVTPVVPRYYSPGLPHLHKSHISESTRLARLLMAACLAYIWIVYLGALCEQDGWVRIIHRGDRCDHSLFQLGLRLLAYFLKEDVMIPVAFYITV